MAPLFTRSSPELGIRLEGGQTRFSPGHVVVGCVYRSIQTVSPQARLTVAIHGWSESKITTRGRVHYGRFNFFDPSRTTQVLLLDKPLHIQPDSEGGGATWHFAIRIPSYIDWETLITTGASQQHSFLSLGPCAVATHQLAPSFNFEGGMTEKRLKAFVEYYVQAELQLSQKGKIKIHRVILPLPVKNLFPGPPVPDFKLKRQPSTHQVCSQRLVPGTQVSGMGISLSQKTSKLLGSSKGPKFACELKVDVPTALQLESPNYVPLCISIEPLWNRTSVMIQNVPQRLKLESLTLRLIPVTEIKVQDMDMDGAVDSAMCGSEEIDLITPDAIQALGRDIYISCPETNTDASLCDEHPGLPIDIGELLEFRLGYPTKGQTRKPFTEALYPGFTTYNIHHSHCLWWDIRGTLAGEKIRTSSQQKVILLPPPSPVTPVQQPPLQSTSWRIRLPGDEPPPPSYPQSQMEAGMQNVFVETEAT
ncbi:uncharacterized protein N7459_007728 [Penicillium hispanicum]|uniref:uncharacterized protein n=1 Tax=Penicillium hispanicum TaxID=1080232 RepID=UPI002540D8FE|nr:uncharacterized protein N7459_007728 [Penicillium hispanicum]KAJ5578764.1 hypothetical protein N7459_007728 [Penicillium hispanicum]